MKLNFSYIKEVYLSDGYKDFNPNGSIYLDMEDGEKEIKEFVLNQLKNVEVFVADIADSVKHKKQSANNVKFILSKAHGVKITCDTKKFGGDTCNEYFTKMSRILSDFDEKFERIKVIVLARDSKKTNSQGVIIINMKRREWLIRRYLRKHDD